MYPSVGGDTCVEYGRHQSTAAVLTVFSDQQDALAAAQPYSVRTCAANVSCRYEGFLEVIARLALRIARKDAEKLAPTSKQVVAEKRAAYKLTNYTDAALATLYDTVCDDLFHEI